MPSGASAEDAQAVHVDAEIGGVQAHVSQGAPHVGFGLGHLVARRAAVPHRDDRQPRLEKPGEAPASQTLRRPPTRHPSTAHHVQHRAAVGIRRSEYVEGQRHAVLVAVYHVRRDLEVVVARCCALLTQDVDGQSSRDCKKG